MLNPELFGEGRLCEQAASAGASRSPKLLSPAPLSINEGFRQSQPPKFPKSKPSMTHTKPKSESSQATTCKCQERDTHTQKTKKKTKSPLLRLPVVLLRLLDPDKGDPAQAVPS